MSEEDKPDSNYEEPVGAVSKNFFSKMWDFIWENLIMFVPRLMGQGWEWWSETILKIEAGRWQRMLELFTLNGTIDQQTANRLATMQDAPPPMDYLYYLIIYLLLSGLSVANPIIISLKMIKRDINQTARPEIPDPLYVARAAIIDPKTTPRVHEILTEHGFTEKDIKLIFKGMYNTYPEEQVRHLFFRGILDTKSALDRLGQLGFSPDRSKQLMAGWEVVPPVQDLITMVAHEAFEPEIYKPLGLMAESPTEQMEFFAKHGLSEEWVNKYWISHWDQPSVQMGLQMLHRNVIDADTLNILFKVQEIPPFWRDKITAIAYNPFTRVDVRRMHKIGVLTDEQLTRSYMDLGYSEEKALAMTQFTILYNQGAEKDLSKSEILQGFREEIIDEDTTYELLIELGYSETEAGFLITKELYKQEKTLRDLNIKNIQLQYKKSLIDVGAVSQRLDALGIKATYRETLIAKWKVDNIENKHLLSKADLAKLLGGAVITTAVYISEMQNLGYNEKHITWMVALLTPTAKAA